MAEAPATWPERFVGDEALLNRVSTQCRLQLPSSCAANVSPRAALSAALATEDPTERDHSLAALQTCKAFPPGFIASLRAYWSSECAETVAVKALGSPLPDTMRARLHALRFVARLKRFDQQVGTPPPRITVAVVDDYAERRARPWLDPRVEFLERQQTSVAQFAPNSDAEALALFSLAQSWLSLLSAPTVLPSGGSVDRKVLRDYDLRTRLYGNLERLRSAPTESARRIIERALRALASSGSLRPLDPWIGAAIERTGPNRRFRSPYSNVLLPRLALRAPPGEVERLLEALPPPWLDDLLETGLVDFGTLDATALESLLMQGLSRKVRRRLAQAAQATTPPPGPNPQKALWVLARHHVRAGLLSHERQQFVYARERLTQLSRLAATASEPIGDEARFYRSLTDALETGPAHLADWSAPLTRPFDTRSLVRLASAADLQATLRGLALANAAMLNGFAGTLPAVEASYEQLLRAQRQMSAPFFQACIEAQLDGLRDTGPWGSRCRAFETAVAANPERRAELVQRFGACPAWAWNQQRTLDARKEVCKKQ